MWSEILVWQASVNPSNIGVAAAKPATLVLMALIILLNPLQICDFHSFQEFKVGHHTLIFHSLNLKMLTQNGIILIHRRRASDIEKVLILQNIPTSIIFSWQKKRTVSVKTLECLLITHTSRKPINNQ